jgi:hypothetical protein
MSSLEWPESPPDLSADRGDLSARDQAILALYNVRLAEAATQRATAARHEEALRDRDNRMNEAMLEAENRRREAVLAAYLDVGKSTLERMLKRSEGVASAASIAGTIYGAVLGVSFSLQDGKPLPIWGVVPVLLFGASLVFVAIFIGFVRSGSVDIRALATGTGARADQNRLNNFLTWMDSTAMGRAWALWASILCLGGGIATIPLPFIFLGRS